MKTESPSFAAVLSERREALVAEWLQQVLRAYPESSVKFLARQQDPFRNPVGHTLHEGLSVLFDGVVQKDAIPALQPALDGIVRVQAVQDISASRAVAFLFLLKRIIRTEVPTEYRHFADEFAALEERIDELALIAFDLFVKCREQILELKANESRRMRFLSERICLKETAGPVNETR